MPRAEAIYRALLSFYPAAFRQEYGGQMIAMFSEQLMEARRARNPSGPAALWAEACLDVLTIAPKEHFHVILQDLRYGFRTMAKSPGFTCVAILSLALGIGANTAVFSLWNGIVHASLPMVRNPEELVMLTNPARTGRWHGDSEGQRDWLTYEEFNQLRDHADNFQSLAASESSLERLQIRYKGATPEEIKGRFVSSQYFNFFGVSAFLGRVFTEADRVESPAVVLSYGYWQSRFGGQPDVLGKTFTIRNASMTVAGVTPKGFIGETMGHEPDVWMPLEVQPYVMPSEDRLHDTPPSKSMWLHVFGRLKPGVARQQALAQANTIFKAGLQSFYGGVSSPERRTLFLNQYLNIWPGERGASSTRSDFSDSINVLLAAVGVLLLIACANLANLLLARGTARTSELALRLSLGASRGRLIRQLVTESLALALIGGVAGLGIAWLLHGALVQMVAEADRNFRIGFSLDPLVLAFTTGITLAAAHLFGLLPALQITSLNDAGVALKEQSRSATASAAGTRWGRILVSVQLALSLPLIAGAGLLMHTLYNLQHVDLGYPTDHLVTLRIDPRAAGYEDARRLALLNELLTRFQNIPGVRSVTFSHNGLFTGGQTGSDIEVEGFTPRTDQDRGSAVEMVSPGYFSTLQIPLVLGREFTEADDTPAPKVCVVNEAFAKRFFEGRNPVGMHITDIEGESRTSMQIVGVARNSRTQDLRGEVAPKYYIPAAQPHGLNLRANFLFRIVPTAGYGKPGSVLTAARREVQSVDASLPILDAATVEEVMSPSLAQERSVARLASAFGVIALGLAAIGLYGVLAYSVTRRRSEIAIRMALGAEPGSVILMILRETSGVVLAGLIFGVGLAYGASRMIAHQLYGIAPQDPLTLGLACAVLIAVALAAAYVPAQQASRVDPMAALRQE